MANLGDHLYISSYLPSLRLEEVLRDDEEGFRTAGPIVGDEMLCGRNHRLMAVKIS